MNRNQPILKIIAVGFALICGSLFLMRGSTDFGLIQNFHIFGQFSPLKLPDSVNCRPIQNVVFVKTHKCASSAVQNILFRYGENHGLNFGFPSATRVSVYYTKRKFKTHNAHSLTGNESSINLVCFHGRADFLEYKKLMKNKSVAYITILRDPVKMFESWYDYYLRDKQSPNRLNYSQFLDQKANDSVMKLISRRNDIATGTFVLNRTLPNGTSIVVKEPANYYSWNPMLYDLGLDNDKLVGLSDNEILEIVKSIDENLDFTLIADRMDESLVLLKELLCWDWSDMVVFSKNQRERKYIDFESLGNEKQTQAVLKWNHGDSILFDYFSKQFDVRVAKYGVEKMASQVKRLQSDRKRTEINCIDSVVTNSNTTEKYLKSYSSKVFTYQLKTEKRLNGTCVQLVLPEVSFIRRLMKLN